MRRTTPYHPYARPQTGTQIQQYYQLNTTSNTTTPSTNRSTLRINVQQLFCEKVESALRNGANTEKISYWQNLYTNNHKFQHGREMKLPSRSNEITWGNYGQSARAHMNSYIERTKYEWLAKYRERTVQRTTMVDRVNTINDRYFAQTTNTTLMELLTTQNQIWQIHNNNIEAANTPTTRQQLLEMYNQYQTDSQLTLTPYQLTNLISMII